MFSKEYLADRKNLLEAKTRRTDGHWIFTGAGDGNGYGKVRVLMPDGQVWYPKAHALSYLLHVGDLTERMDVCHICSFKRCINPEHLYLGTRTDNLLDSCEAGTSRHHGKPLRLTDQQIREIRSLYSDSDLTCAAIAERYSVQHQSISRIGRFLSYSWVK